MSPTPTGTDPFVWVVISALTTVVLTFAKVFWDRTKECELARTLLEEKDAEQGKQIGALQATVRMYLTCNRPDCPYRRMQNPDLSHPSPISDMRTLSASLVEDNPPGHIRP
jgi:hypothetical protein